MFRLIAIALTSTFLLLALFGTSSEQAPAHQIQSLGMMGVLRAEEENPSADPPSFLYVARPHQPVKTAPDPSAGVLRILPQGAMVEVVGADAGGFLRVRDPALDAMGFMRADSLSDVFPG